MNKIGFIRRFCEKERYSVGMSQEKTMSRREAREAILSLLFSHEYTPEKTASELESERVRDFGGREDPYVAEAAEGVLSHLAEIDAVINASAVGWSLSRISHVSLAVLRLACYEMLFRPEIPPLVSLDEAVELSKKYDDENAYSFVNGVLNRAMKSEEVSRVARG